MAAPSPAGVPVVAPRLRVGACLSLSGRFAPFGRQAADGLKVWQGLDGRADLVVEDDASDPDQLAKVIGSVARRSDVLLGPYSTQLLRRAGAIAAERGWLLWNHGGSGDDVQAAHPGHVVSVLTPTSRYAAPFLPRMADDGAEVVLWVRHGTGRFGRQVAHGARDLAAGLGIEAIVGGPGDEFEPTSPWYLFSAGTFEDDVATVRWALDQPNPPHVVCSVAAGVRSFAEALGRDPVGVFGVGQWFQGSAMPPLVGPQERAFVSAYRALVGAAPDYPAAQAIAAASIAAHCVRLAGGTARHLVWPVAADLETTTLFGDFRIDPATGVQLRHEMALMRWTGDSRSGGAQCVIAD